MNDDKHNVYAKNAKGDVIYVSEVTSGRNGYYCLGCGQELQAVIAKTKNRIDYFRHDPKNVDRRLQCVYSDETYRHKLAKEILQRLRMLKVPTVYKYPPHGMNGLAIPLTDTKYIEADHVGIEVTFFEDVSGNIQRGMPGTTDDQFLVIRPDVVFFNKNNEPILFIEIVVSHSIKQDKIAKLKRLKIDTVQVTIPKDSPESIEDNFHTTTRVKWVYNYVQETTSYLSIAGSTPGGISQIDQLQRKFFEESAVCRSAEIGNLLRSIKRCLESKPYSDAITELREATSRAEQITISSQGEWDRLRESIRERVKSKLKSEFESVEEEERRVGQEEKQFERESNDLERRYYRKRDELIDKERELDRRIEEEVRSKSTGGIPVRTRFVENERAKAAIRTEFESTQREIEAGTRDEIESIRYGEERIGQLRLNGKSLSKRFEEIRRAAQARFDEIERKEEAEIRGIGESIRTIEEEERGLTNRFESIRRQSDHEAATRNGSGNSKLSGRIRELLQVRQLLLDYEKIFNALRRNRSAWQCFSQGTYKNWKE